MSRSVPVFTVFFYAVSYPIGSLAVTAVSPFTLIALRFALTATALWIWVWLRHLRSGGQAGLLPRGRSLGWGILVGMLVHGVQFLGLYWALAHGVGAGVCALVIAMNPVATAVLGRLTGGRPENAWGFLALCSGTAGVVAACLPKLLADPGMGPGFVATLIALLGLAVGSLLQGRRLSGIDPIVFTALGTTVSLPPSLVLAATEPTHFTAPPTTVVPALGVLVMTSAVATAMYAACVRRFGARSASVLFAVIPGVATVAAWIIQRDALTGWVFIALCLGAVACVSQVRAVRSVTQPTAFVR